MRIGLIYLGKHGPGGPISFELASHLSQKTDLFVVVSKNADHIASWRRSSLRMIEVETFNTKIQAAVSWFNSNRVRRLARQISSMNPDVLLFPMVHPWTPALQKYLPGIPVVTTVHDPTAHPGIIHRLSSLWEKRSARMASRCIVLGHTFVAVMEAEGVAKEKIDVIPLAVFSFYDNFGYEIPVSRLPRTLLFFGRITQYKGLDVLLRAFRLSQAKCPELRLSIVGEGDMRPYRQLIDNTQNVTVTNSWVADSEVPGIFQAADIVIVPYTSASQSGVIALAASFGRPVIATRVGAIPEQIRDGKTGLLVNPGSDEALAAAIDRMLEDHKLRDEVAHRLAEEMRAGCNWHTTSDAYLESCRKAILGISLNP